MSYMFQDCWDLEYINIINLDTRGASFFDCIFRGTHKIKVIYNPRKTHPDIKKQIKQISLE